jgi:hypothetical protein
MDASAMACEAKALQRSFLDEALSIVARVVMHSTSRSLCRTGAMPPFDLGIAANAF